MLKVTICSPKGDAEKPLKVLLFDSWFDRFRGVVCLIEVIDGKLKKGNNNIHHHHHSLSYIHSL